MYYEQTYPNFLLQCTVVGLTNINVGLQVGIEIGFDITIQLKSLTAIDRNILLPYLQDISISGKLVVPKR